MKRCGMCGTYWVFAVLATEEEKYGFSSNVWDYDYECLDDNECYRRQQMKMNS